MCVYASNTVVKELPQRRGSPSNGCPERAGQCPPAVGVCPAAPDCKQGAR